MNPFLSSETLEFQISEKRGCSKGGAYIVLIKLNPILPPYNHEFTPVLVPEFCEGSHLLFVEVRADVLALGVVDANKHSIWMVCHEWRKTR